MDVCIRCEVSGDKARLFDAVSEDGIVKICSKCLAEEDMPIIKRPTTEQLKEIERKPVVYSKRRREELAGHQNINLDLMKQESSLRDLVDKNIKKTDSKESRPRPDLVDNFHWIIRRARKSKKITRKQAARDIGESELVIEMAERGILPEDDNRLVNKLENYLGIRIVKSGSKSVSGGISESFVGDKKSLELGFDSSTARTLTISDLKEMREQGEAVDFEKPKDFGEEIIGEKKEEVSDEDMNDIIFGRK